MTDLCMVNDYTESLFIKISNDAMPLVIGLIDRPPNSNIVQLTKNLNDTFVQVSHMPCYIMGDCNVDFLKMTFIFWLKNFLEAMYSNSLLPTILKPTRETATIATLMDDEHTLINKVPPTDLPSIKFMHENTFLSVT